MFGVSVAASADKSSIGGKSIRDAVDSGYRLIVFIPEFSTCQQLSLFFCIAHHQMCYTGVDNLLLIIHYINLLL